MSTILGIVLVLGLMILLHETGHFVAAKWFGVRVETFSIGYPPRLWGKRWHGTDYCISALPFGGYIKMGGHELSDTPAARLPVPNGSAESRQDAPDDLLSKPRWQRAVIAFAGPAVNLVLPVLLLAGFFVAVGLPYPAYLDKPVEVVALPESAPGGPDGLRPGDRIVEINGIPNPTWEKGLSLFGQAKPGTEMNLQVENNGTRRSLAIEAKEDADLGYPFGYAPIPAIIDDVRPGMPAHRAGLRVEDQIIGVNGQQISTWSRFVNAVKHSGGNPVMLRVRRKDQELNVQVDPQQGMNERSETVWQVGVQVRESTAYRRIGVVPATRDAVLATASGMGQVIGVIGKLFTGKVSVRQLQGVIGLARDSGQAVRRGVFPVIWLMATISLNLGILNLLPIPVLDGGHILLLSIEGLIRRDLSLAFKERFIQVGFVFLLVIMAYAMYNDVVRMLPAH